MTLKKIISMGMMLVTVGGFAISPDFVYVEGNKKISDFYICDHEVTQAEYKAVMGTNPSEFVGDNNPVESVSWYNAVEYCNKRSEKEGLSPCYEIDKETKDPNNECEYDSTKWTVRFNIKANGYRLPTDAEWKYAAKGGNKSKGYKYYGSNEILEVSWYSSNSYIKTHPVKQKKPNELGLYDMSGNVWEWCWNWYSANDKSHSEKDYAGPTSGFHRIIRGGSYNDSSCTCVVADLNHINPTMKLSPNGIRLVRSAGK